MQFNHESFNLYRDAFNQMCYIMQKKQITEFDKSKFSLMRLEAQQVSDKYRSAIESQEKILSSLRAIQLAKKTLQLATESIVHHNQLKKQSQQFEKIGFEEFGNAIINLIKKKDTFYQPYIEVSEKLRDVMPESNNTQKLATKVDILKNIISIHENFLYQNSDIKIRSSIDSKTQVQRYIPQKIRLAMRKIEEANEGMRSCLKFINQSKIPKNKIDQHMPLGKQFENAFIFCKDQLKDNRDLQAAYINSAILALKNQSRFSYQDNVGKIIDESLKERLLNFGKEFFNSKGIAEKIFSNLYKFLRNQSAVKCLYLKDILGRSEELSKQILQACSKSSQNSPIINKFQTSNILVRAENQIEQSVYEFAQKFQKRYCKDWEIDIQMKYDRKARLAYISNQIQRDLQNLSSPDEEYPKLVQKQKNDACDTKKFERNQQQLVEIKRQLQEIKKMNRQAEEFIQNQVNKTKLNQKDMISGLLNSYSGPKNRASTIQQKKSEMTRIIDQYIKMKTKMESLQKSQKISDLPPHTMKQKYEKGQLDTLYSGQQLSNAKSSIQFKEKKIHSLEQQLQDSQRKRKQSEREINSLKEVIKATKQEHSIFMADAKKNLDLKQEQLKQQHNQVRRLLNQKNQFTTKIMELNDKLLDSTKRACFLEDEMSVLKDRNQDFQNELKIKKNTIDQIMNEKQHLGQSLNQYQLLNDKYKVLQKQNEETRLESEQLNSKIQHFVCLMDAKYKQFDCLFKQKQPNLEDISKKKIKTDSFSKKLTQIELVTTINQQKIIFLEKERLYLKVQIDQLNQNISRKTAQNEQLAKQRNSKDEQIKIMKGQIDGLQMIRDQTMSLKKQKKELFDRPRQQIFENEQIVQKVSSETQDIKEKQQKIMKQSIFADSQIIKFSNIQEQIANQMQLQKKMPIKSSNLVFKWNGEKKIPAKILQKKRNLLIIIRTDNGSIVGGFTDQEFNIGAQPLATDSIGFLFSRTANRQKTKFYALNKPITKNPAQVSNAYLIYGSSELRIPLQNFDCKVISNIGLKATIYKNPDNDKALNFFGIKQGYEARIQSFEIIEIQFLLNGQKRKQIQIIDTCRMIKPIEFFEDLKNRNNQQLKLSNYSAKKDFKETECELPNAHKRIQQLTDELQSLRKKNQQLEEEIKSVNQINRNISDSSNLLQVNAQEMKKKIEQKDKEINRLKGREKQLRELLDKKQEKILQISNQLLYLQEQKQNKLEEIIQLNLDIDRLKDGQIDKGLIKFDGNHEIVIANYSSLKIYNQRIKEELQLFKAKKIEQSSQVSSTIYIKNLSQEKQKLRGQLASKNTQIIDLKNENKFLSKKIADLNEQIQFLKKQIKDEEEKLKQKACELSIIQRSRSPVKQSIKQSKLLVCRSAIFSEKEETVHYHQTLFQGDIFQFDEESKSNLIEQISNHMQKKIVKTKMLYKYDKESKKNNFHSYIDEQQNIVLVVKTNKTIIAGYYSGKIKQKQIMNKEALLISVSKNESYYLSQEGKKNGKVVRGVVYDKYYIIFGNAQIRIKAGQNKVFSNFGIMNSYFDNRKRKVAQFLMEGEDRDADCIAYEFHKIYFNKDITKQISQEEQIPREQQQRENND